MSFLFGKSKKNQPNALPAATRDVASSHGSETRIPTANGIVRPTDALDRRHQTQPASSGSLESMRDMSILPGPEPVKPLRQRSESDLGVARTAPNDSPYPWSTRRLNFSSQLSPFPRYGAAANSASNKEGQVYLMGGLVDSQTVKGDLWMIEVGNGSMACYPINTTSEGPGPRVGHSSLLVGNAFIVFGGDTKLEEGDVLDDTLYLLNISTKQWSRASPAGPRPAGRYGHTLNILGSKIFIFGGQVEGYFFNDLVAFDLNSLQTPGNRWEVMIPNGGNGGPVPKPRTNHSVITWQDKLYLFGGTDGTAWFNDVWVYDSRSNAWAELDCIGYIPAPREGHAASIVNDTMYIFGGRLQDGTDLGDLAAFRISSRRWYMFQNMGSSPSARSGHSMTAVGKHIVVVAGEPSSAPRDATELSWAYVLDTTKIRYPQSETGPTQSGAIQAGSVQTGPGGQLPLRKFSGDQSRIPQKTGGPVTGPNAFANRGLENGQNNAMNGQQSQSRLPRNNGASGPPPPQAAPQPRGPPGALPGPPGSRSRTPNQNTATSPDGSIMTYDRARDPTFERKNTMSPDERDAPGLRATSPQELEASVRPVVMAAGAGVGAAATAVTAATMASQSRQGTPSRTDSRSQRQQESIDSTAHHTPRQSEDLTRSSTRDTALVDSGLGSSPSLGQHNDELVKELEAARSRNAWLASELALARKSGYNASPSTNPLLDQQAADAFGDDDRPLIEALLEMKAELNRVQGSIETQAEQTASRISEIEKQRDAAVSEAVYARAKLAAHGGSQAGTPQPDARGNSTPDLERNNDMGKRLASMLTAHNELNTRLETITSELESERRARNLAEDTAGASQRRAAELDTYKQRTALELESLRAELHEAKRLARDESANCAEALASLRMYELDKNDISSKHARIVSETKNHTAIMQTLREAVTASTEKADLLERRVAEERELRESSEKKHSQLRAEHEERLNELSSTQRQLKDTEELAQKHAEEARTHKAAVLSGLDRVSSRDVGDDGAIDERVAALQEQLNNSNEMSKKHKSSADGAADRLRRAEERIAGLETYQEQTARESLSLRKQLQSAMKEVQAAQSERNGLQQRLERNMLEGNALEVQLRTLKNLLEERGVSTADVRRSRILDSPNSRYGTPEMGRVRDLERQLDDSLKAHEEIRSTFEQREQEMEEKLASYETDRDGAVKYVHGLEKLLAKMKQELQRAKAANVELEKGLQAQKAGADGQSSDWEAERDALRNDMTEQQKSIRTTVSALEAQIATLKTTVSQAEQDRDAIRQDAAEARQAHEARIVTLTGRATADLEALRHENSLLEERAVDAEKRAQLFLDQFESSVDTYRRQSRLKEEAPPRNGMSRHGHTNSIGGESMYSNMTDTTEPEEETDHSGDVTPSAHSFPTAGFAGNVAQNDKNARDRSSTALDSLATELDALRSQWEETSKKSYRLSDRFDFERNSTTVATSNDTGLGLNAGNHSSRTAALASPEVGSSGSPLLGDWRKKMDLSIGDSSGASGEDRGKENLKPTHANGDFGGEVRKANAS